MTTSAVDTRLGPLPLRHEPELADEFDTMVRTLGFVPNSVLTMQRKPKLVKAFAHLQRVIWDPESLVDRGLKRLVVHMASRVVGDAYSMAHTASGALHFGISGEKLAAIVNFDTSPLYSPAERAALDFAMAASSQPNAVSDDTFVALRTYWSEEQIVEIVSVIAMAGFLSRWNQTFATPLETECFEVGEKYLAPLGWNPGKHRR
ncbi:MAG: carboxymuconolactone decarboxylase family protein [Pseudorhodoplanes sp.]|uniref:carboxymuconolactone decarboxylase family protein n=1 Tax=Pseudorhodoplanes sp. TaxID=1934341 RepID=UPI003D10CD70